MGSTNMATSRSRTLAALLSEAVADSKHTQRSLGTIMGVSHVTIGRWLRGETAVDPETAATLLAHLGITGNDREEILALARKSDERDWLVTGSSSARTALAGVVELERRAVAEIGWAPLTLPGLLQTADYTKVIMQAGGTLSAEEAEGRLIYRLSRRDAIHRVEPLKFTALLGMPAVMARIGGAAVMRDQLRHLINLAGTATITIQIVPDSEEWHGGLVGPFDLYELPDQPSVVHLENHRSGVFLDDTDDVTAYKKLAEDLRRWAMTPEDTIQFFRDRLESKEMR